MPVDVDKQLKVIETTVDQTVAMMRKNFGPAWDARSDLAKILITVSSAILGAILAFSTQLLAGLATGAVWLAILCMVGLLFSLASCVYSLYAATELSAFQARQFNRRPELREKIAALDETDPRFQDNLEEIWKPMLDDDLEPVGTAANRSALSLKIGVSLFLASLVGLVVLVGVKYGAESSPPTESSSRWQSSAAIR